MVRPLSYDRENALEKIEDQFRKTGYAGTSIEAISTATGLGKGSLYGSFGDKRALLVLTLTRYGQQICAEVEQMLAGPDADAVGHLGEFILSASRFALDDVDRRGCMAGKMAHEVGPRDPEVQAVIKEIFDQLIAIVGTAVAAGQRHGHLDKAVKPEELACLIVTLSRGFDVLAKGGVQPELLTAAARQAIAGLPYTAAGRRAALDAPPRGRQLPHSTAP